MKKLIFIFTFVFLIATSFFFYNDSSIADDKNGKCCNGEGTKTENCKEECKSKCNYNKGQSSGEVKECPYMSGKNEKMKGECPYTKRNELNKESSKKSGTCPYMKKEIEAKI